MRKKGKRALSPDEEGAILPKPDAEPTSAEPTPLDDERDELDPEDVITEVITRPTRSGAA